MKYIVVIFLFLFCDLCKSQISCESIMQLGVVYKGTDHRDGRKRIFKTDTAITNRMQFKNFELRLAESISAEEKKELELYKISFNPTDTIMFYDWDIMNKGKIGYHGKAVAKVRINCNDSMIYTQKYLLKKDAGNYVPNRHKIFRMNENDFIIGDRNHPYLNINVYFKKD